MASVVSLVAVFWMSSNHRVTPLCHGKSFDRRLLIAQGCNIKKSSVFLLLNMHIIVSSWQMLYFQCLIIRFYRFSLILPKRKKKLHEPALHAAVCLKFLTMIQLSIISTGMNVAQVFINNIEQLTGINEE